GLVALARIWRGAGDWTIVRTTLLLLVAASMFPHHLEHYYGEVFTAVLVAAGLAAVAGGASIARSAAALLGVGHTPASSLAFALVAVVHTWDPRRLRHLLPPLVAAAGIVVESRLRHGTWLTPGYADTQGVPNVLPYSGRPGFSYPLLLGVASLLLSFGKGLV